MSMSLFVPAQCLITETLLLATMPTAQYKANLLLARTRYLPPVLLPQRIQTFQEMPWSVERIITAPEIGRHVKLQHTTGRRRHLRRLARTYQVVSAAEHPDHGLEILNCSAKEVVSSAKSPQSLEEGLLLQHYISFLTY